MATVVSKTLASRTTLAWQPFDQVDGFSNKGTKLAVDFSDPKVTLLFVHIEANRSIARNPNERLVLLWKGKVQLRSRGI
jgi:hypothetical protein